MSKVMEIEKHLEDFDAGIKEVHKQIFRSRNVKQLKLSLKKLIAIKKLRREMVVYKHVFNEIEAGL